MVLVSMGKKAPRKTRKYAGFSPIFKQMMATGIQATGGIGRTSSRMNPKVFLILFTIPIAMPTIIPAQVAMENPTSILKRLVLTSGQRFPSLCVSISANATEIGPGMGLALLLVAGVIFVLARFGWVWGVAAIASPIVVGLLVRAVTAVAGKKK